MSTIINLRGTSGSGKSTVVHTLLKLCAHQVVETFGKRGTRPLVYKVDLEPAQPLYVLGPYQSQCGGCDAITDYKNILPTLLPVYAEKGNVLFEGLLISGGYGSVGLALRDLETAGHRVIFALLDTPLELCLERVNARRAARGVLEPVNPKNTAQKHRAAHNSQQTIASVHGHECALISHKRPVRETLALLDVTLPREPRYAAA